MGWPRVAAAEVINSWNLEARSDVECERKIVCKDDSKVFGLRSWKHGVAIY